MVAKAIQPCAPRDELTHEGSVQSLGVSSSRELASVDGVFSLTRSLLTTPELLFRMCSFNLAGHATTGYL